MRECVRASKLGRLHCEQFFVTQWWWLSGIRPQDNPEASLYPLIADHIEKKVADTGKKVVVKGSSGGTINGYGLWPQTPISCTKRTPTLPCH